MKITDKIRLDWVEKQCGDLYVTMNPKRWAFGGNPEWSSTPRKAIDAAIRAERREKKR